MIKLRKQPPAEPIVDPESEMRQEEADRLSDVAFDDVELNERAQAALELAAALQPGVGFEAELRRRIPKIAADLGRAEADVRERLSEMVTVKRRYEFLRSHDLDDETGGDAREKAQATLKWLTRRRKALDLRLEDQNLTQHSRDRLEAELAQLDRLEEENFSFLHAPAFWNDRLGEREVPCRCGRPMQRRAKFFAGRCAQCLTDFLLRTGRLPPAIPPTF